MAHSPQHHHKLWLLHSAHPAPVPPVPPTSPCPCTPGCPITRRALTAQVGRYGGRLRSSGERALCGLLPGKAAVGCVAGARSRGVTPAALALAGAQPSMAGPHAGLCSGWGLSLGSTHEKPKGELCSFPPEAGRLAGERAPRTDHVAEPSHHLRRRGPCQQQLLTAAGAASSGSWAGGKGEPREREETQLLLGGSCCPSTCRSKQ